MKKFSNLLVLICIFIAIMVLLFFTSRFNPIIINLNNQYLFLTRLITNVIIIALCVLAIIYTVKSFHKFNSIYEKKKKFNKALEEIKLIENKQYKNALLTHLIMYYSGIPESKQVSQKIIDSCNEIILKETEKSKQIIERSNITNTEFGQFKELITNL